MTPELAAIEARVRQLLTADPVCQGKVSATTIHALALEFARDPAPDSDVLAERAACLALMQAAQARLDGADSNVPVGPLEARRLGEAIESVRQGLHRMETIHGKS